MKQPARPAAPRDWLALLVVVTFVMAYKSNDALSNPQFWAEDGYVFFKQQFGHVAPQLFTTHFGYLHLVPRLVAWIASWLPATKAPLIYNASAILLSAAAITLTCMRLRRYLSPWIVAVSFLAVPVSGEIFGTITNVQWFLQFALAAYCLTPEEQGATFTPLARGLRASAVFITALTGPFSIFVSAIVVAMLAMGWTLARYRRDPLDHQMRDFFQNRDLHLLMALALGAAVQFFMLLSHPQVDNSVRQAPLTVLETVFTEIVPIHIFGSNFLTGTAWILLYALIIGTLLFSRRVDRNASIVMMGFVALAGLETLASMLKMPDLAPLHQIPIGDRYFYLVKVCWWWAVWLALRACSRNRTDATAITTALICVFAVASPHYLRRAALTDHAWRAHAAQLSQPGPHTIPLNPDPGVWSFTVGDEPPAAR